MDVDEPSKTDSSTSKSELPESFQTVLGLRASDDDVATVLAALKLHGLYDDGLSRWTALNDDLTPKNFATALEKLLNDD